MAGPRKADRRQRQRKRQAARQAAAERAGEDRRRRAPEQHALDDADAARWHADRPRVEAQTYARLALDDSKHRPVSPDPLLVGRARVTGATAKAVSRRKALTRHEWEQIEARNTPTNRGDPHMRINVYAEELTRETELVTKTVTDEKFGTRTFYGVRMYLASPPELHADPADDDRSAITFWVPWTRAGGHEFAKVGQILLALLARLSEAAARHFADSQGR